MEILEILGYRVRNNRPYGYLIDDGDHVLNIQPEAKRGYIHANLKSVIYKKSDRVYTAPSMLFRYEGLANLIAKELAETEPIYDYSEHVFYDPEAPTKYWKRSYILARGEE